MRKRPRRATALFSTPGDQNDNGNMIVKAPHSAIWRNNASFFAYARQSTSAKPKIERPAFSPVHVDTYEKGNNRDEDGALGLCYGTHCQKTCTLQIPKIQKKNWIELTPPTHPIYLLWKPITDMESQIIITNTF